MPDQGRVGVPHAGCPEVEDQLFEQVRLVADQLRVEEGSGLEGVLLEHALAEAVDRRDRGPVEVVERSAKSSRRRGAVVGRDLGQVLQDDVVRRLVAAQALQGLSEALAHPVLELAGGRLGEGDDEDVLDLETLLQHEPQHEARDGPGLAGAGARLDERGPLGEELARVEGLHRSHRLASMGW